MLPIMRGKKIISALYFPLFKLRIQTQTTRVVTAKALCPEDTPKSSNCVICYYRIAIRTNAIKKS